MVIYVLIKIRGERIGCSAYAALFADALQGKICCRYFLTFFCWGCSLTSFTVDLVKVWFPQGGSEE